jgi:hypothetical protein
MSICCSQVSSCRRRFVRQSRSSQPAVRVHRSAGVGWGVACVSLYQIDAMRLLCREYSVLFFFAIHSVRLCQLRHSEIDKRAHVNLFGKEDTLGWDEEERQMNCFPGKRRRRNLPRRTRRRSASVSPTKSRLYFQTGTAAAAHERAHTLHCSLVETDSRTHARTHYEDIHTTGMYTVHTSGESLLLFLSPPHACSHAYVLHCMPTHPISCSDYVKYSLIMSNTLRLLMSNIPKLSPEYVKYS